MLHRADEWVGSRGGRRERKEKGGEKLGAAVCQPHSLYKIYKAVRHFVIWFRGLGGGAATQVGVQENILISDLGC